MRTLYDGLDTAKQTNHYLRGLFCGTHGQDDTFSYCVNSAAPQTGGHSLPDSPDPDMHGCRIDLRKEMNSQ